MRLLYLSTKKGKSGQAVVKQVCGQKLGWDYSLGILIETGCKYPEKKETGTPQKEEL